MKYVKYFDFCKHEYYALIAVEVNKEEGISEEDYAVKAAEIYLEVVAGDSLEEVLDEAPIYTCSKQYAFMRFMQLPDVQNMTVESAIKDFEDTRNGVLILDGTLV